MRQIIFAVITALLVYGCLQNERKRIATRLIVLNRADSIEYIEDSFEYKIATMNDSGYCVQQLIEKGVKASIFMCVSDNPDSIKVKMVPFLPTYLYHIDFCYPRFEKLNERQNFATYYQFESTRKYQIGNTFYTVNSYLLNAYGSDSGHRLYFSPDLGMVAGFATGWRKKSLFENDNDAVHKKLQELLVNDSTFFPMPEETTILPPKPE
ncbi:MAG: hypothetical protein ACPGLV_04255 [Bacteroidia bacterium]